MKKHPLFGLLINFALISCADMEKDSYKLDSGSVKIGVITNFTGDLATFGRSMYFSTHLAVQEINAAGGVNGQKLEIVRRVDKFDKLVAQEAAVELVAAGVVGIIGSQTSSATLAIAENVTIKAGIPLISGSATSPLITDVDDANTLYRTVPSDAFQGAFLAEQVHAANVKKAAVIYVDNAYGAGLAGRFEEKFLSYAGTSVTKISYAQGKSKDFGAEVTQLLSGLAADDAVLIFGYETDSAAITAEIAAHGGRPALSYWGCDGNYSPAFLRNAAVAITANMKGSSPQPSSGANYAHFESAFEAEVKEKPTLYSENVYDAVYLLALAMAQQKSNASGAIVAGMTEISRTGTVVNPGDFAQAVALLDSGTDINYEGAAGDVDFDDKGDVEAPFALWKVNSAGTDFE